MNDYLNASCPRLYHVSTGTAKNVNHQKREYKQKGLRWACSMQYCITICFSRWVKVANKQVIYKIVLVS